mmetsp:Transcript_6430/g.15958  ORF Transcript_6430/g.15958 Transcript_6430/m.15958 type:complete len:252 (+) Transcript_6430:241-996(+)
MMMSKPTSSEENQEEAPAFAMAPPPTALNVGSVADLERRLAEMGTKKEATPAPPPAPVVAKPAAPAPATTAAAAAAAPSVKGGKNALLARIMAAKEKQEKKGAVPPPPPPAPVAPPAPTDLLMDFDAPSTQMELPPPSYETNFLKDVPPPAFDVMEQQQQQQQPGRHDALVAVPLSTPLVVHRRGLHLRDQRGGQEQARGVHRVAGGMDRQRFQVGGLGGRQPGGAQAAGGGLPALPVSAQQQQQPPQQPQ